MTYRNIIHSSANFPQRFYALMENDNSDYITWCKHGLSFRINDPDNFSSMVLPRYFKHDKLTSFQRQLNLYGFKRITKGEDLGAYFHPKFQRGRKDLLNDIRRIPNKSLGGYIDTYEYNPTDTASNQDPPPIQVDVFLNESPVPNNRKGVPIKVDFFLDQDEPPVSKKEKPKKSVEKFIATCIATRSNSQLQELNLTNEINVRKTMVFPINKNSNIDFNSKPKQGGPSKLTLSLGFMEINKANQNVDCQS